MYRYDDLDRQMLADRTSEFRLQANRRLAGEITEDQFKPLRLMNGLYLQLQIGAGGEVAVALVPGARHVGEAA